MSETLAQTAFRPTVLMRTLTADLLTPVGVYLSLRDRFTDPVLLESNETRDNEHYYSIIGLDTLAAFTVNDGKIDLSGNVLPTRPPGQTPKSLDVVAELQAFTDAIQPRGQEQHRLIKTFNALIGHTTFEGVQYFDTLSFSNPKVMRCPDLRYHFYRFVLVFHHYRDELLIIENLPEGEESRTDEVIDAIRRGGTVHPFARSGEKRSNLTDAEHRELIAHGKRHCQRGDVFQIVLGRQFQQDFTGDEFQVYRALRSINPSPYLFYFDYGDYRILGSSPESQMVIENGVARVNPIAGTYRRTGDKATDEAAARDLLADPKENAEHVMLVDLARNDLGRHTTDVTVKSLREVHFYSHVIHLVSAVEGKLTGADQSVRVFGDTFPAGTLSGAPKYRAMELIDNYENQQRGFYGGALGFIGLDGNMNQAIVIRTFFSQDNTLFFQAGGGIVAKSVEETEVQEVHNKLGALTRALVKAETL